MEKFGVIYLIWNMVNGKKYVGQTCQPLEKRISQHKCSYIFIAALKTKVPYGYNLTGGGDYDFVVSDESRARMSEM